MNRYVVFPLQMWMSAVWLTVYAIKMQAVTIQKGDLLVIAIKDFMVMEVIAQVRIPLSLK